MIATRPLSLIYRGNHPDLGYHGGQGPVLHLQADLFTVMDWAERNQQRWAFTLSNAGALYVESRCQRDQLSELNWQAINASQWSGNGLKESKQAEFLVERHFPWQLVERIGVHSRTIYQQVANILPADGHRPPIEIQEEWYY
ncbi:hypothetical protein DK749_07640 [Salmonella enterica subsp. salamae]|nr:hypothetical protein [Salmonella enterica subsp. salamae]